MQLFGLKTASDKLSQTCQEVIRNIQPAQINRASASGLHLSDRPLWDRGNAAAPQTLKRPFLWFCIQLQANGEVCRTAINGPNGGRWSDRFERPGRGLVEAAGAGLAKRGPRVKVRQSDRTVPRR